MSESLQLLAVIRITDYNEDISHALHSVVANRQHFCGVHIVSQGGPSFIKASLHTDLEKHNIPYVVTSRLDDSSIHAQADAILEIPPMCRVDKLAIQELITQAQEQYKNVDKTHFSLGTTICDDGFSFAYGWLFILYMIEWFWCSYERFKLPLDRYVRMTYVIKKGNQKSLSTWKFAWRLYNTGSHATLYRPGWALIDLTQARIRRWNFVTNSIYRHEHVGNWRCLLGNWWFILWWLFYWALVTQVLVQPGTALRVLYGVGHVVFSIVLYIVMSRRTRIKGDWLLCLLHPIYLITFPVIMLTGRISRPRTFWSKNK